MVCIVDMVNNLLKKIKFDFFNTTISNTTISNATILMTQNNAQTFFLLIEIVLRFTLALFYCIFIEITIIYMTQANLKQFAMLLFGVWVPFCILAWPTVSNTDPMAYYANIFSILSF